jgi:rhamnosyltransferase
VSAPQPLASVCAVIVTYHPDLGVLRSAVTAIHGQVQRIVIVDNGSPEDTVSRLRHIAADVGAHLIPSPKNLGVAAGHNLGIAWARRQGCTHVLLLDQDSVAGPNMVAELLAAHRDLTARGVRVAAVGPRYVDSRQNNPPPFLQIKGLRLIRHQCLPDSGALPVDYLISSGSLISLATLKVVGPMREDLFIDYVDIEWGLRARHHSFQSYGVCSAKMEHSLGEKPVKLFKRSIAIRGPLRHYYQFRNAILLYRSPVLPLNWKIVDGSRLILRYVFYTLFAKPRLMHWKMMIRRLIDGLRGRTGPFPPQSAGER